MWWPQNPNLYFELVDPSLSTFFRGSRAGCLQPSAGPLGRKVYPCHAKRLPIGRWLSTQGFLSEMRLSAIPLSKSRLLDFSCRSSLLGGLGDVGPQGPPTGRSAGVSSRHERALEPVGAATLCEGGMDQN